MAVGHLLLTGKITPLNEYKYIDEERVSESMGFADDSDCGRAGRLTPSMHHTAWAYVYPSGERMCADGLMDINIHYITLFGTRSKTVNRLGHHLTEISPSQP